MLPSSPNATVHDSRGLKGQESAVVKVDLTVYSYIVTVSSYIVTVSSYSVWMYVAILSSNKIDLDSCAYLVDFPRHDHIIIMNSCSNKLPLFNICHHMVDN